MFDLKKEKKIGERKRKHKKDREKLNEGKKN